ncbi:MAG: hypothetical protein RLO50_10950 [Azospirillaceae bacterium]
MATFRDGWNRLAGAALLGVASAVLAAPAATMAQPVNSEARLGNVVIDCAELPAQVLRRLPPCQEYYEWSQRLNADETTENLGDPLVTLNNGMVFRCSELGEAARQIPECLAGDVADGDEGQAAPDAIVERP